jgi:molybdate transport system regulatory protein
MTPTAKTSKLPSLSLRIDLDTESRIGPGKIRLLEAIHSNGSISAGGRSIGMSYKRAWDLVDEINRICARQAVDCQKGGSSGGGARLTPFGLTLVARYRMIEGSVAQATRKERLALQADMDAPKRPIQ